MALDPKTNSVLGEEEIAFIKSLISEDGGYFRKIVAFLETYAFDGIRDGKFTLEELYHDLTFGQHYVYACNNCQVFSCYCSAIFFAQKQVEIAKKERNACFFYRLAVAYIYVSRIEMAQQYLELAIELDAKYPWSYLELAKIYAHQGRKEEALALCQKGLQIEKDDYEFLTLIEDIKANKSLEEMQFHFIKEVADQDLQNGISEEQTDKRIDVQSISVNKENLATILQIFGAERDLWGDKIVKPIRIEYDLSESIAKHQDKYAKFISEQRKLPESIEIVFDMSEGSLSKLNLSFLLRHKEKIDDLSYLFNETIDNQDDLPGILKEVVFLNNGSVFLTYKKCYKDELFEEFIEAWRASRKGEVPAPFLNSHNVEELEHIYQTFRLEIDPYFSFVERKDILRDFVLKRYAKEDEDSMEDDEFEYSCKRLGLDEKCIEQVKKEMAEQGIDETCLVNVVKNIIISNRYSIILLKKKSFNLKKIVKYINQRWRLKLKLVYGNAQNTEQFALYKHENFRISFTFTEDKVLEDILYPQALRNYTWPGAMDVVQSNYSTFSIECIKVQAVDENDKEALHQYKLDIALMQVKIVAAIAELSNTLAVTSQEMLCKPQDYANCAKSIDDDVFPLLNVVTVGLYRSQNMVSGYTAGLSYFNLLELEFLPSLDDADKIKEILTLLAAECVLNNTKFKDGDIIKINDSEQVQLSKNKGIVLDDQETFKVKIY